MSKQNNKTEQVIFNDQWKIWIWTNIGRGCDKDEIFRILMAKGFSYEDISIELGYTPTTDLSNAPGYFEDNLLRSRKINLPNAVQLDSDKVELYQVPGFLNQEECAHLIEVVRSELTPSTLLNHDGNDPEFRTSRTNNHGLLNDQLGAEIDIRICRYMGINPTFSETIQGQYYLPGEVFKPHTDWFSGDSEGFVYNDSKWNQRTWTFMIYLNDVEHGGETEFPNVDYVAKPKRGDAIIWNNQYRNGEGNNDTLHCSKPFDTGFKAVITKWFRGHGEGEPNIRHAREGLKNYHSVGFEKFQIPPTLFDKLQSFLWKNSDSQIDETGSEDYLTNFDRHPSTIIQIPEALIEETAEATQPILEKWGSVALELSAVYGIRKYARGSTLSTHRDRDTHILSAILNIDQEVDEPWPLNIEDHYFRRNEVYLEPGEMLLYESARLNHGREIPLNGDYFCNLFVHFQPRKPVE